MCIVQRWKLHARQKNVTNCLNERFAIHCHCCGCFCKIEVCLSQLAPHLAKLGETGFGSAKASAAAMTFRRLVTQQRCSSSHRWCSEWIASSSCPSCHEVMVSDTRCPRVTTWLDSFVLWSLQRLQSKLQHTSTSLHQKMTTGFDCKSRDNTATERLMVSTHNRLGWPVLLTLAEGLLCTEVGLTDCFTVVVSLRTI
jgi:hypothetical protein